MYLRNISLLNYKNIAETNLDFSSKINCIVGDNGAGKTNLLDAVYFLCCCKSRTNPSDKDNIMHGEEFFMLEGTFDRIGTEEKISVGLKRGKHKSFKRNGKEYQRLSEHIGLLPAVMVSPDDGALINEGSEARRKFVDGVISQYDGAYLDALLRYNRLLVQRNAMLRDNSDETALFEVCEMQMEGLADIVYRSRMAFIDEFIPIFRKYYERISSAKEIVDLKYRSHLQDGALQEQLQACRNRDFAIGYTTKGVHKDDIEMFLGDYPIKRTGSQGQGKTFLIALKLAQFDFLRQVGQKVKPILLLDDIFDKLDASRVGQILKIVSDDDFGQIFITDTNREHIDTLLQSTTGRYALFLAEDGKITVQS